ncbi:AraC family transcriptional regulator [Aliikangiella coralliicola]|uniref:Helix-turn-helix domain-containing protein n=1 Tax=Aliikangiella coralliicola TaxID=2592383 RepID=A0A545TW93_9GAMM|nr:helix-turn-helix domain-containing protein [Aliikangiella coralliicola]TQV81498.1 helix-turn-helix domain-containing protein [Aliikangiella coralliicola]
MDYRTFPPHQDLAPLINRYWTLEVPASDEPQKQRIIPDGCIEMAFILGDDIKRYTSENEFIFQPRAMVLGQTVDPFYIEPSGYVNTFAVSFYPYGFANIAAEPIRNLVNKETPIELLFGESLATELERKIVAAANTEERIKIIEEFLLDRLNDKITIDNIVKSTVDMLLSTKGGASINDILKQDLSKRRQLERKFVKQIGISPKQLGKVIRLQTALKILLNEKVESLTSVAYKSEYYDQAHFIRDFKEFTGVSPKEFLGNKNMALSSLFYK